MTNEEAIKILDELGGTCSNDTAYIACHMAIEAVEKQIPKKPIHITRNEHSTKIIGYGCPTCHKDVVGSGFYCWSCGQAIDWNEVI